MPATRPDTADRSLAHWSEAGRREMDAFYALARLDYELLAKALDWDAVLRAQRPADGAPVALLDVACGSGKFPDALARYAPLPGLDGASVDYALLDPSAFSLSEAASVLRPPMIPGARYESTLEALDPAAGPWDVVWATHALYALLPDQLEAAMRRFAAARKPSGFAFLAQGARSGHYLAVYEAFLDGVRGGQGTPYLASEDLVGALEELGERPQVRRIAYEHVVAQDDRAVLEGYLQRCLFDDTLGLDALFAAPRLGRYLAACHDEATRTYRFHQEVDLVVLCPPEGAVPWTQAAS